MAKVGSSFSARWCFGEQSFYWRKAYERWWYRRQREALREAREQIAGQRHPADSMPEAPLNHSRDHTLTRDKLEVSAAITEPHHFIVYRESQTWCAAPLNFRDFVCGPIGRGYARVNAIINLLEQREFLDGVRQGKWRMPTLDEFIEVPKPQGKIPESARGSDEAESPLAKHNGRAVARA